MDKLSYTGINQGLLSICCFSTKSRIHCLYVHMFPYSHMQYNTPRNDDSMGLTSCLSITICMCRKETQWQRCHQHEYECHDLPYAAEYGYRVNTQENIGWKLRNHLKRNWCQMQCYHHIFRWNYVHVFALCLHRIYFIKMCLCFSFIIFLFYICVWLCIM